MSSKLLSGQYSSTNTPGKLKYSMIQDKLNSLPNRDDSKYSRRLAFEQRLRVIEDQIRKSHQRDEATFKIYREQIEKLEEALNSQSEARRLVEQRKEKELKVIETNLNLQNNIDRQNKHESEAELVDDFEQKVVQIRGEIHQDKRESDKKMSHSLTKITDELSMIQGELFAERKDREENYDMIIKRLGGAIMRMNEVITSEKYIRQESHSILFRMLEEMQDRLGGAMEQESRLREQNQSFLLNLLDSTVTKVQDSLQLSYFYFQSLNVQKMKDIGAARFSKEYQFIRNQPEPIVGDWKLYKHSPTLERRLVKELKFGNRQDRDIYITNLVDCPFYLSKVFIGTLQMVEYALKEEKIDGILYFLILAIFEGYENTLEKVVSLKIKDSQTFSITEIFSLLKQIIEIMENIESFSLVHGDIRFSSFVVSENGNLKIIWTPFLTPSLRIMKEKTHLIKNMNPSPELVEAFNLSKQEKNIYSAFAEMQNKIIYQKNDVYSTAIMILRMCDIYSSASFYKYDTKLEINTHRVEEVLVKVTSLNSKLGKILGKMLTFDCFERPSFTQINDMIKHNKTQFSTDYKLQQKGNNRQQQREVAYNKESPNMTPHNRDFDTMSNRFRAGKMTSNKLTPLKENPFKSNTTPVRKEDFDFEENNNKLHNFSLESSSSSFQKKITSISPQNIVTRNSNLFEERSLHPLKLEMIKELEKAVFYNTYGTIRKNIEHQIRESYQYIGEMLCGQREGIGLFYFRNDDISIGNWERGSMKGENLYFYSNGSVYAGNIHEGKKQGFGKILYINGDVYEGDWLHNKKHGSGVYFFYQTGEIYEGEYSMGFREGNGTLYSPEGVWVEGEWKQGVQHREVLFGEGKFENRIRNIVDFYTDIEERRRIIDDFRQSVEENEGNNNNTARNGQIEEDYRFYDLLYDRIPKPPKSYKTPTSSSSSFSSEEEVIEEQLPPSPPKIIISAPEKEIRKPRGSVKLLKPLTHQNVHKSRLSAHFISDNESVPIKSGIELNPEKRMSEIVRRASLLPNQLPIFKKNQFNQTNNQVQLIADLANQVSLFGPNAQNIVSDTLLLIFLLFLPSPS